MQILILEDQKPHAKAIEDTIKELHPALVVGVVVESNPATALTKAKNAIGTFRPLLGLSIDVNWGRPATEDLTGIEDILEPLLVSGFRHASCWRKLAVLTRYKGIARSRKLLQECLSRLRPMMNNPDETSLRVFDKNANDIKEAARWLGS